MSGEMYMVGTCCMFRWEIAYLHDVAIALGTVQVSRRLSISFEHVMYINRHDRTSPDSVLSSRNGIKYDATSGIMVGFVYEHSSDL